MGLAMGLANQIAAAVYSLSQPDLFLAIVGCKLE
jgi:hypothetical protein